MDYTQISKFNIMGHQLKEIRDVMLTGHNLYLVGPTDSQKLDFEDGIIKYRTNVGTYDEYSYPELSGSLSFVRKDYYNPDFA